MEAGTTAQCSNAREGAIEGENERERRERACSTFPTRHSLPVCESYSAPRRKRRMRPSHILLSLCGYRSQKNYSLNNKKRKNTENYNNYIFTQEQFSFLRGRVSTGFQINTVFNKWSCVWQTFQRISISILYREDIKWSSSTYYLILNTTDNIITTYRQYVLRPCMQQQFVSVLRQRHSIIVCGSGAGKQISSMKKMIHLA